MRAAQPHTVGRDFRAPRPCSMASGHQTGRTAIEGRSASPLAGCTSHPTHTFPLKLSGEEARGRRALTWVRPPASPSPIGPGWPAASPEAAISRSCATEGSKTESTDSSTSSNKHLKNPLPTSPAAVPRAATPQNLPERVHPPPKPPQTRPKWPFSRAAAPKPPHSHLPQPICTLPSPKTRGGGLERARAHLSHPFLGCPRPSCPADVAQAACVAARARWRLG